MSSLGLDNLAVLPDPEAEVLIFRHMRRLDEEEKRRYASIGLLTLEVERRELWKHRPDPATGQPCRSLARWLRVVAPAGYSTCYAALATVKALSDVPTADLAQIPHSNLSTMTLLSTKVRADRKVVEAAKKDGPEAFVAHVRKHHPEQALEPAKSLRFRADESAVKVIEEVLAEAIEQHGARDRSEALEMIAVMARQVWQMEAQVEAAHGMGDVLA